MPTLERALAGVLECHVALRNWRAVLAAEDKLLAALATDSEERVERLLEFGDRALENENVDHARARFGAARDAAPSDPRPLERLLTIAEQAVDDEAILALRSALIEHVADPAERARAALDLAAFCLETGDHEEQALQLLERALDDAPGELEALETLASLLADNQEWAELERIYRKVIEAYEPYVTDEDGPEHVVLAELYRKLALLFRDHLEDPEQALVALDKEFGLRPDDLEGRLLAAELATELELPAQALVHLRHASELAPMHAETYRRLHTLGQQFSEPETAFLAASVLHALGEANEDERATYEASQVQGVPALVRPLRREAWSWLRTKQHDTLVDQVMRAIAPSVLRARVLQLEEKKKLPALPERQDPKTSTASVVRSIGWASQFLGVEAPAIYLDDKVEAPLSARFARHQAMVVGKTAMRGRSIGELAFLAGRHLALRQAEHELVSHMASIDELSACFLAAVKLALGAAPSGPLAAIVDALATALASQTSREERAQLDAAVKTLTKKTAQLDLTAWVGAVERCATRAGYVLCGDLALAIKLIDAEGDSAFTTARERIADLCSFTVSGQHMKLRQELGSSLVAHGGLPRVTVPSPGR
jgi:tetratricopeptide (TPR) repeat protein